MNAAKTSHWDVDPSWYSEWSSRQTRLLLDSAAASGPLFSIVMPCYETPASCLRAAIESLLDQSYPNWELCICDDGSTSEEMLQLLSVFASEYSQIRVKRLHVNSGIAVASNLALDMARGEYVIPMDHDDLLPVYALGVLAQYLEANPGTRLAYSDSDRVDCNALYGRPYFKPDWNYDLFLAQNYLNHLTAIEIQSLRDVGGWRAGYEGSQDYDLYLRLIEQFEPDQILHVPHILYHWREIEGSFSQSRLGAAISAARSAVADHLQRTGRNASISAPPGALIYNYIRWEVGDDRPKALLVLIGDRSAFADNLVSTGVKTADLDIEVVTLEADDGVGMAGALRALIDNHHKDILVILNGSVSNLPEASLQELAACCMRPEVGCVGPKCIDQQGLVFGLPELLTVTPGSCKLYESPWQGASARSRGYFANLLLQQCTDALRPDAIAVRWEHLTDYGNLDRLYSSLHLAIADLCLETAGRGHQSIWLGPLSFEFDVNCAMQECYSQAELEQFLSQRRASQVTARFAGLDVVWTMCEKNL